MEAVHPGYPSLRPTKSCCLDEMIGQAEKPGLGYGYSVYGQILYYHTGINTVAD
jgi:hypothetical protein